MNSETIALLNRVSLLSGLPEDILQAFAAACTVRSLEKGEELFAMGDPARALFFIVDGWVKLYRLSRDGEETIIGVFGPGETFAEAAVFMEPQRYPVNAEIAAPTKLLEIPRRLFVEQIQKDNQFALRLIGAISAKQHLLVQQIEQVTARSAAQRIGTFLLRFCGRCGGGCGCSITLPYDKSLLAGRLSIKPETFSRALTQLREHGVVCQGSVVTVNDPQRLAEFCDFDWRDAPC